MIFRSWKSILIYAVASGLALAIFVWLGIMLQDRTGWIGWTVLIAGLSAACSIAIYLFARWFITTQIPKPLVDATAEISQKIDQIGAEPNRHVTSGDLADIARLTLLAGKMLGPRVLYLITLGTVPGGHIECYRPRECRGYVSSNATD